MKVLKKHETKTLPGTNGDYIGIVLVDRGSDYVTWEYTRTDGQTNIDDFNCFCGHYMRKQVEAITDFNRRVESLRG